jgi:phosphoglycerol transferase
MKIAILNAFPNLSHSAEREFIRRSEVVLEAQGHTAMCVTTSDEIDAFAPDFVLLTHEFVPKLTDHFTVGLLWSPTQFYKNDPARVKAIRSWDLTVPINRAIRNFARDIHFPERHVEAVSALDFLPSAPVFDLTTPDPSKLSLAYVGTHWDGQRHAKLLRALSECVDLNLYGPPGAWEHMKEHYRGSLPFDGESVIRALNGHGAVLAVHKDAHAKEGTPSMRVFEACSAKCLVFTDPIPQLVDLFGTSLHYVDTSHSPRSVARSIASVMSKAKTNPTVFLEQIHLAADIFRTRASLEQMLTSLVEDVAERMKAMRAARAEIVEGFDITVIIRCGSRPLSIIKRAVASCERQTYRRIGLLFACFAEIDGFEDYLAELRASGRFLFVKELKTRGGGIRSIAMWDGLNSVETDLFCMNDDDDELFYTHFSECVEVLRKYPDVDVAYSGTVRQEEDGSFFDDHPRFKGDLNEVVKERRFLQFFSDYNLDRMLRYDNFIQSNSWLARKRVLTADVLVDPDMEVSEDMYFYLLLSSRFTFKFTGTASAVWNWRSKAKDNSLTAVSKDRWMAAAERVSRRLAQVTFKGGFSGRDILERGLQGRETIEYEFTFQDSVSGDETDPLFDHASSVEARSLTPALAPSASEPKAPENAPSVEGFIAHWLRKVGIWPRSGAGTTPALISEPEPFDELDLAFLIDFTNEQLPDFLVSTSGLSLSEPLGRWTDGTELRLRFSHSLPKKFTLELIGFAFKSCHEKPITIRVGPSKARLIMSATSGPRAYRALIENSGETDTIIVSIPDAKSPFELCADGSGDKRRLGMRLISFGIYEEANEHGLLETELAIRFA